MMIIVAALEVDVLAITMITGDAASSLNKRKKDLSSTMSIFGGVSYTSLYICTIFQSQSKILTVL